MREIRLSGSVRGVRRNPYPYRDVGSAAATAAPFFGMLWLRHLLPLDLNRGFRMIEPQANLNEKDGAL